MSCRNSRSELLIHLLTERFSTISSFSSRELYELETALESGQLDMEIVQRLLGGLDFPFYNCRQCKADYDGSCGREDDPELCYKRWEAQKLE